MHSKSDKATKKSYEGVAAMKENDFNQKIPRCSASGLIKIPFDTSQLCCEVVH